MAKFFEFNQNNSGGSFTLDEDRGLTHIVIVEANDARDANYRALSIGIYFDGCVDDIDCACCGDRWSEAYGEGDDVPSVYGQPAEKYAPALGYGWMPDGKEICVHFIDGRKQWHGINSEQPA